MVERLKSSPNPPKFFTHQIEKRVMEDDRIGHMVELIQAFDNDVDDLFYTIIGKYRSSVHKAFKSCSCYLTHYHTMPHSDALNSLPNDKILDWSELKAFAEDKMNVT